MLPCLPCPLTRTRNLGSLAALGQCFLSGKQRAPTYLLACPVAGSEIQFSRLSWRRIGITERLYAEYTKADSSGYRY